VFVTLAIAVALPVLGGVIVSSFASPLQDWYRDLEKPSWEPPDWLFGVVWSVLYVFMGLASWLVWADGGWAKQGWPLKLYCTQLVVNYLWPIVFFSLHQLPLGVAVIGKPHCTVLYSVLYHAVLYCKSIPYPTVW